MPLPADATEAGQTATLVVVAGLVGAGIKWLWDQFWTWRTTTRGERAAAEKTIVDHQAAAIRRLEEDAKARDEKVDDLQERVGRSEVRAASLIGHLRYLETLLRNAKVEFVAWADPNPDTGTHRPVTEAK